MTMSEQAAEIARLQEELGATKENADEALKRTEILKDRCAELKHRVDAREIAFADFDKYVKDVKESFEQRDAAMRRMMNDFHCKTHDDVTSTAGSNCSAAGSNAGSHTGSTVPSTAASFSRLSAPLLPGPRPVQCPVASPVVSASTPHSPPVAPVPPVAPAPWQGLTLALGHPVVPQLNAVSRPSTPASSAVPSRMGTPAPSSNVGDHDHAESLGAYDMPRYDLPCVPGAHERSRNCLENKYHTEFFSHYADPTTLRSQRWGPTGGSRDLDVKDFAGSGANRLCSFNVSIANHPDCLLHNRLWRLAGKGAFFVVDGHNGGGGHTTQCLDAWEARAAA